MGRCLPAEFNRLASEAGSRIDPGRYMTSMKKVALAAQALIVVAVLGSPAGAAFAQPLAAVAADPIQGGGPLRGARPLLGAGPLQGAGPLLSTGPLQGAAPAISAGAFAAASPVVVISQAPTPSVPILAALPSARFTRAVSATPPAVETLPVSALTFAPAVAPVASLPSPEPATASAPSTTTIYPGPCTLCGLPTVPAAITNTCNNASCT